MHTGRGFNVIAVALDQEGWTIVTPFLRENNLDLRVVLGHDALTSGYGVKELPTAFLIDRKGRIAASYIGLINQANMESNIAKLVAEP